MIENLLLIISHRRSGTHLAIDSIINNFKIVSKNFFILEQVFPTHERHQKLISIREKVKSHEKMIIKSHMTHNSTSRYGNYDSLRGQDKELFLEIMNRASKIYVVRDGRDVMVSFFHYLKSISDYNLSFLEHLKKHLTYWKNHVNGWFEDKSVLTITYESFEYEYLEVLSKIEQHTQLELKENIVNIFGNISPNLSKWKRIQRHFLMKFSIIPTSTAVLPRKGVIGDWKNYFDSKSKEYFKTIAGDLIIRLGYEKSNEW